MEREILSTNRKALRINLNPLIYGSFAEIGGGQEVARHFFQAGGASGTVAKTISAYDKSFSDALYNKNKEGRYVSEGRLAKMLDTEYTELTTLLKDTRDPETTFFAFANTVETLNFSKSNDAHGWMGLRYQCKAGTEANEVIVHVRLKENDGLLQQQSLGIFGVNLVFACYYYYEHPNKFLRSLLDNLSRDRIEITMIRMSGPDLDYVDNRLLAVQLVKNGMTNAVMFDRNGDVQQPSDMLYKKNILAFRGSFRPITYVGFDMLKSSFSIFKKDEHYHRDNTFALCEMTLNNLMEEGDLDEQDFLDRVDILNGMGQHVMVSTFKEYYKLVTYFSQFRIGRLRIVIGIPTFLNVLEEKYYTHLKGGILEALGRLFPENMKFYVYPTASAISLDKREPSGDLLTSENMAMSEKLKPLYEYLIQNRKIIDIKNVKKDHLHINSPYVLKMIKENIPGWELMVPNYIEEVIKKRRFFAYSGDGKLYKDSEAFKNSCK
ncbi:MAG: TonB-dependent receptor [Bacteroidetes bacterium]|nr:TonB-dependent receptor [Bacteroidota bacterium]